MNQILTTVLDIGEEMLISGGEISRVEESIQRMGVAWGAVRVDAFIITSSMVVTLHSAQGQAYTQTRRIAAVGTDIERIHKLNALSRDICTYHLSCEKAGERLSEICRSKPYPFWAKVLAYGMIASAFAVFFGGWIWDAVCGFLIGAILPFVVGFTEKDGMNKVFARFLSSLAAVALAFLARSLGIIETVDYVVIGNIMLLIPGVALTVALKDLFVGDNLSGILRTIEALLFAFAVAGGYFLAAFLVGDVTGAMAANETLPWLQMITGCIGSLGFSILFNVRGWRLVFAGLGGLLSWGVFLAFGPILPNEIVRYFIAAAFISVFAEMMARALKTPTTTFIITSLIPLIPGGSLYYTMTSALFGDRASFVARGITTLGLAGALAAGIIVIAGFTRVFYQHRQVVAKRHILNHRKR